MMLGTELTEPDEISWRISGICMHIVGQGKYGKCSPRVLGMNAGHTAGDRRCPDIYAPE